MHSPTSLPRAVSLTVPHSHSHHLFAKSCHFHSQNVLAAMLLQYTFAKSCHCHSWNVLAPSCFEMKSHAESMGQFNMIYIPRHMHNHCSKMQTPPLKCNTSAFQRKTCTHPDMTHTQLATLIMHIDMTTRTKILLEVKSVSVSECYFTVLTDDLA